MNILKRFKKYIYICIAAVLLIAFAVTMLYSPLTAAALPETAAGERTETSGEFTEDASAPEGMLKAAGDDRYTLYINTATAAFSVYDSLTGSYWNSNPTLPEDAQIGGTAKAKLNSQLVLTYYDAEGVKKYYNTYENSIETATFEVAPIKNGAAVTYKIGDTKITIGMLPGIIEKEVYEEKIKPFLEGEGEKAVKKYYRLQKISGMTESRQEDYKELYPGADTKKEYYFLDIFAPDYAAEKLYNAIFKDAEYTQEDMMAANDDAGYTGEEEVLMQVEITAEYTLEDGALKARIPAKNISVPSGLYLTEIDVLPFFGAASREDNGYMIVPDGSGGIVNLNSGRVQTEVYTIPVYGKDGALTAKQKDVSQAVATIPVYAMVKNDNAFLSIIESGEEYARVCTVLSGMETDYNQIYTSFNILSHDQMSIEAAKETLVTNRYADEYFKGDITVSYRFYGSDKANYTALANEYRDYLIEKGELTERQQEHGFYVSVVGNVKAEKNAFGIPYEAYETVTSFGQAKQIAEALKEAGVDDVNINYSSWYGGGLAADAPIGVSPDRSLGGKNGLYELGEAVGANNVSLGASVQKIWSGYPEFKTYTQAIRLMTNKSVKGYEYNVATNLADEGLEAHYLLNPRYVSSITHNYTQSVASLGEYGVWLQDIGTLLNSDFAKGRQISRTQSKQLLTEALSGIDKDVRLTLTNPNGYTYKYADVITQLPVSSSGNYLVNQDIPFLQTVLAGCVDYTVPAVNSSGDYTDNILKAAETGSDLYFDWIYASDEYVASLEGKEPQQLYSRNYENWIEQASESYKKLSELHGISQGAILSHTKLLEGVWRTEWEEGSVIVNYNQSDVQIEDNAVKAKDFIVIRKG